MAVPMSDLHMLVIQHYVIIVALGGILGCLLARGN
jgi:hypothetical protein